MIPYVEQPSLSIGPLTIHAFGIIVATAVLIGLEAGRRRFRRLRLDAVIGERLVWWAVGGGFLGAHLFSVLFYFPHEGARNPFVLFKLWEDISSFGGMLGGTLGTWLFFTLRARDVPIGRRWAYLDAIAFVFPVALAVGRVACSVAHDHPGTLTHFPLAVSLESPAAAQYINHVYSTAGRLSDVPSAAALTGLGFHDLGWYEFLYLAVVVVPVMLLLDRRPRPAGFYIAAFILMYMPARFALDFLRISDARYAGLTPAQYAAAAALVGLPALVLLTRRSLRAFARAHSPYYRELYRGVAERGDDPTLQHVTVERAHEPPEQTAGGECREVVPPATSTQISFHES